MMLFGVAGLTPSPEGLRFRPCLPAGLTKVELRGLKYRDLTLNVTVEGTGCKARTPETLLPWSTTGKQDVRIVVTE